MANEIKYWHVSYNDIHNLIRQVTPKIAAEFNPDLLIAIGGGGFFPARVMRTFLRQETGNKTLQIQAIGLSLYEPVDGATAEQIGNEVIRTQWLGPDSGKLLLGKHNLIVDEVDDTRKTLHYALSELKKDVEAELLSYPEAERETLRAATQFGIFVVHNKLKPKRAELPSGTPYFAGEEVEDVWLNYPWEATDIEEHDRRAASDRGKVV
ncbi:phosphoribosyltransferase-like protein [Gymnopilus junonius]|uniref:Phosphoribosyltransferase-like protein n=1 Tax=Gymnopilus junonius TaxID=109634 RepID=A0A9P5NY99_GYMJU|nr:phosphoribosyltransferase-like protein [Gymnopilus junonius]